MQLRDAVIIGGGLAGAAAATRLARNGVDVVLLEKEEQPHHKVCGEFVSHEAQYYLEKCGVDLAISGAQPIDYLRLVRRPQTIQIPLGFRALSLSRQYLDEALLVCAQKTGAEIKRSITVTAMTRETSCWRITCHERAPIIAKTVFLATGKHDLRGWSHRAGRQNDYIGFKMHFQLSPAQKIQLSQHVELILFHGGYAGLEPVEQDKANLCLVVAKAQFATCGKNWDRLLHQIMQTTPVLAERLNGAIPSWAKPLAIFGIPYGFVYKTSALEPADLFRLGDQMAVIPSLCGDGMAIALHTGFLAADCYLKTDAHDYHYRARKQLLPQINCAMTISHLISSPLLQPFILSLCRNTPKLMASIIKNTRLTTLLKEELSNGTP